MPYFLCSFPMKPKWNIYLQQHLWDWKRCLFYSSIIVETLSYSSQENNEDCLPCLFIQFCVIENGRRVSKILQVCKERLQGLHDPQGMEITVDRSLWFPRSSWYVEIGCKVYKVLQVSKEQWQDLPDPPGMQGKVAGSPRSSRYAETGRRVSTILQACSNSGMVSKILLVCRDWLQGFWGPLGMRRTVTWSQRSSRYGGKGSRVSKILEV